VLLIVELFVPAMYLS